MASQAKAPRKSIPGRIFLGFMGVLISFASVSAVSLVQHNRTAQTLRLLQDGYLPLSLGISEARATQGAFATMVERSAEGGASAAAEGWLEIARRVRPIPLRHALDAEARAERLVTDPRDIMTLRRIRAELEAVLLEHELSEEDFENLSAGVSGRDRAAAAAALASVRQRERSAQSHLAGAWVLISERIASTSRKARDDEQRAFGLLVGLGLVALAVSIAITFWAQRMLMPLTKLSERVMAVARGDLSTRLERYADDEIGRVAGELERMVDALNARDKKLRQAERLAAVGRISAHVTHEVRNPLNSIRLNVEMLEEDLAQAAPESRNIVAAVASEVDRLTAITEQYLRLARLPEPKLEVSSLEGLVRDVVAFTSREMESAGIDVVLDIEPCADVALDEPQMRQALLNLCRNAREAMPQGGRLHLSLRPSEGGVLLTVSDEGSGIDPEEREKVFDLFYTTKQHGTGLGLPLTQQIVAAHGGQIRCEGAEPRGTRFEIWLAAADAQRALRED